MIAGLDCGIPALDTSSLGARMRSDVNTSSLKSRVNSAFSNALCFTLPRFLMPAKDRPVAGFLYVDQSICKCRIDERFDELAKLFLMSLLFVMRACRCETLRHAAC